MRTVRILGRGDLHAVVASLPERVMLAIDDDDADIVLATPSSFVDGAVPLVLFAPRIDAEALPDAALVDITVERARIDELSAIVEALAVLRRLVGPVESIEVAHRGERVLVLRAGAATITIVGSPRDRDSLLARAVTRRARVEVAIDATTLARAARCSTFTEGGEHVAPLVHQSAVRLLLQQVLDGADPAYGAAELQTDLALVAADD